MHICIMHMHAYLWYIYVYILSCNSCGSITNRFNESHMLFGLLCLPAIASVMQIPALSVPYAKSVRQFIRLPVRLPCLSVCLSLCLSPNARSSLMFARHLTTHWPRANKVCLIDSYLILFIS